MSTHECSHSTWITTTADGWRQCALCSVVQRLVNGQWQLVEKKKRKWQRRSVWEGVKIKEGAYVDESKFNSGNLRDYWKG